MEQQQYRGQAHLFDLDNIGKLYIFFLIKLTNYRRTSSNIYSFYTYFIQIDTLKAHLYNVCVNLLKNILFTHLIK